MDVVDWTLMKAVTPVKIGSSVTRVMTKLSVLLRSCAVATAVKINPVSQVIGLSQDSHTT